MTGKKLRRLLTFDELYDYGVLLSRRQIDRIEKVGKFPKRVQISDARVGWVEEEIIDHVKAKIAARSTAMGTLGSTGQ
jgi:predicted DNA-binding transcriptional regulator AlpA